MLWQRKHHLSWNRRSRITAAIAAVLLLFITLPLPRHHSVPAVSVAGQSQTIYLPSSGRITAFNLKVGDRVTKGQHLLTVDSHELNTRCRLLAMQCQRFELELAQTEEEEAERFHLLRRREELVHARAELALAQKQRSRNRTIATISGTVDTLDDTLQLGAYGREGAVVAGIFNLSTIKVTAFAAEGWVAEFCPGARVTFTPQATAVPYSGLVTRVKPLAIKDLHFPALSSLAKGDIAVIRDERGRLVPLESYYEVEIKLDEYGPEVRDGQPGTVNAWSSPRSYGADILRHAYTVLLRESSF